MDELFNTNDSEDIAKDFFISSWPNWLRWMIMIPGALIGCFLVSFFIRLLMGFGDSSGSSSWRVWADIIQSFIFGLSFVTIAAYTAPKNQLIVSIIFTSLACILGGMIILIAMINREGDGNALYGVFHGLLFVSGSVAGTLIVKSELEN